MTDATLIVIAGLLPPAIFGAMVAAEAWADIRQAFRDAKRDAGPIRRRRAPVTDLEARR